MIEAFDRQVVDPLRRDEGRGQRTAILGIALAAAALVGVASANAYSSSVDALATTATGAGQCGTLLYVGSSGNGVSMWAPASSDYAFASGRATIRTGGGHVPVELSVLPRRGRIQTQSYDGQDAATYGDQVQLCQ